MVAMVIVGSAVLAAAMVMAFAWGRRTCERPECSVPDPLVVELERQLAEAKAALHDAQEGTERCRRRTVEAEQAVRSADHSRAVAFRLLAARTRAALAPIRIISGTTDALARLPIDPDTQLLVSRARSAAGLLEGCNTLLADYCQAEAGLLDLVREPFLLDECIASAATCEIVAERGVGVAWVIEDDVPRRLLGDAPRLSRAVSALVRQVVCQAPRGTVELRVSRRPTSTSRLALRVEVSGASGEPAVAPAQRAMDEDHSAGALSMAVARQVARALDGGIGAADGGAGGPCIWLDCRVDVDISEECQPEAGEEGGPPPGRILVVEDNPVHQLVARTLLEGFGVQVDTASSGIEAVTCFEDRRYDLVFMDCQMPGWDGLRTTAELREREEGSEIHTPIVALTGVRGADNRAQCEAAGMDGFLEKPVRRSDLAAVLQRWLGGAEPQRTARSGK